MRKVKKIKKICTVCEDQFTVTFKNKQRKTCSDDCKAISHSITQREKFSSFSPEERKKVADRFGNKRTIWQIQASPEAKQEWLRKINAGRAEFVEDADKYTEWIKKLRQISTKRYGPLPTKICEWCGTVFTKVRCRRWKNRKGCSRSCAVKIGFRDKKNNQLPMIINGPKLELGEMYANMLMWLSPF